MAGEGRLSTTRNAASRAAGHNGRWDSARPCPPHRGPAREPSRSRNARARIAERWFRGGTCAAAIARADSRTSSRQAIHSLGSQSACRRFAAAVSAALPLPHGGFALPRLRRPSLCSCQGNHRSSTNCITTSRCRLPPASRRSIPECPQPPGFPSDLKGGASHFRSDAVSENRRRSGTLWEPGLEASFHLLAAWAMCKQPLGG